MAYDSVFSKKEHIEEENVAQKRRVALEEPQKEESATMRLIDLCEQGKISGDQLERLLHKLDGPATSHTIAGYAQPIHN